MSWLWPSRRSSTEKLSNQVMIPWSLTPLTRNIVTGVFDFRQSIQEHILELLTLLGFLGHPTPVLSRRPPPLRSLLAGRALATFVRSACWGLQRRSSWRLAAWINALQARRHAFRRDRVLASRVRQHSNVGQKRTRITRCGQCAVTPI